MRIFTMFSLVLLSLIPFSSTINANSTRVDVVFIIDTSGSMVGLPEGSGNRAIFPEVKQKITKYIGQIPFGSTVFIFPFDEEIHDQFKLKINSSDDADILTRFINGLKADGKNTEIYRSLLNALDYYWVYRDAQPDAANIASIFYLFTDGKDTTKFPMSEIISKFKMRANFSDHLYYFSLGPEITDSMKEFTEADERFKIIRVENEMPVPELTDVIVKVPVLKYGNLKSKGSAKRKEAFQVSSSGERTESLKIFLEPKFDDVDKEGGLIKITPRYIEIPPGKTEIEETIELEVVRENPIPEGQYLGSICFQTDNQMVSVVPKCIIASFSWEPPRIIKIEAVGGNLKNILDIGEVDPFRNGDIRIKKEISFYYTESSRNHPDSFDVAINKDANNPAVRSDADILSVRGEGFVHVKKNELLRGSPCCRKGLQELMVVEFIINEDNIKSGNYKGTFEIYPGPFVFEESSISADSNNAGVYSVPWEFSVAKPPLPLHTRIMRWLIIALILLFLICMAIFFLSGFLTGRSVSENSKYWKYKLFPSSMPRLDGLLRVVEPDDCRNMSIDLEGKDEIVIGTGGEFLRDIDGTQIRIFTRFEEDHVACILRVLEGRVEVENSETRFKGIVSETELGNDDLIYIGRYSIKFESLNFVH
jgi:hypothetical protein